jgi:TIR domain
MMDSTSVASAAAFWSYARDDDEQDGGRITTLAAKLRAEYSLITASSLEMFLDRDSIEWGDAWQQRIEEAIAGTVFFIPIITPRYFTRDACRGELLQFVAQARRVGLDRQFVLPVYYLSVADLEGEGAPDEEAMAIIKYYQWEDLRQVRLVDVDSAEYRAAVNRLAESIARRVAEITASEAPALSTDQTVEFEDEDEDDDDEGEDTPGVLEQLAEMEIRLPRASQQLQLISDVTEELTAETNTAAAEMQKADAQKKGFAGRLRAADRYAARLREPAERFKEIGASYAAEMVAIDAGMLALLDQLKDAPADDREAVDDFIATLRTAGESSREYVGSLTPTLGMSRDIAKMSRSLRKPIGDIETGLRNVIDAQQIIAKWVARSIELDDRSPEDEGS